MALPPFLPACSHCRRRRNSSPFDVISSSSCASPAVILDDESTSAIYLVPASIVENIFIKLKEK